MRHWHHVALAALLLGPRPAHAQPAGPAPVRPARPAEAPSARPAEAPPARPGQGQQVRMGSFDVWVVTDYFTGENASSAALAPRGGPHGQLLWRCAEGGGLWVGVILPGTGRSGETRPVEWRFDDDTPATSPLLGVTDYRRWFLPAEDVARFTLRARSARNLVIRVPGDGAEYVYELEGPGEALDQLACARGTPVAGRIPQPTPSDFSGTGREGVAVPNLEGTYEIPVIARPRIRDTAELARLVRESIPRELRGSGISGSVTLLFRVLPDGRVDAASVRVTASTHPAMITPMIRLARRLVLTPALDRARPVPGWITLPVAFSTNPPAPGSAPAAPNP